MKLTLDEWIVREVIDTLYIARTALLGITGLDSPQDVEKKSANETSITRRISKAIDIIQQSEQPHISESLWDAADEYEKEHTYQRYDGGGLTPEYDATLAEAFIAGAERQYQKDRYEFAKLKAKEWMSGYDEWIRKAKEEEK